MQSVNTFAHDPHDEADERYLALFQRMVDSVGVKVFSDQLGISTRQVNRILAGTQPNPVRRLIRSLSACDAETGDDVLSNICEDMGGFFVREEPSLDAAAVNAVKECAEAIAVISDGEICPVDEIEIREAISALIALRVELRKAREQADG